MALRLSNPQNRKIPGSYELHHRLRRAVPWACMLGSPFFLGLIAGWVFGIRVNGLARMAERRFSNQASHFPATKWR